MNQDESGDTGVRSHIVWRTVPTVGGSGPSVYYHWTSTCDLYRVSAYVSPHLDKPIFYATYKEESGRYWTIHSAPEGPGHPKKYLSVSAAVDAVVIYHRDKNRLSSVESVNTTDVVESARSLRLSDVLREKKEESMSTEGEGENMQGTIEMTGLEVQRDEVVALLKEIQMPTAHVGKSNKEIAKRLMTFHNKELPEPFSPECKALLEDIKAAGRLYEEDKSAPEIRIVGDEPEKPKKASKSEAKKAVEEVVGKKKGRPKKDKAKEDAQESGAVEGKPKNKGRRDGVFMKDWGPRETSEATKVIRELSGRPKKALTIGDKLGLSEKRILRHFNFWANLGAPIEEKEGGWIIRQQ